MCWLDRYLIHLWDLSLESVWENRSVYVYYSELVFELSSLSIDFGHHLHMLVSAVLICINYLCFLQFDKPEFE